jgi:methionine biosynthesis protein MetW
MPFITTDKTSQQIEQLVITKKIIMNINYSLELLKRDKNSRNHIINELILLKDKYNIIDCKILELGCGLGQNLEIFKEDNIVKGVEGLSDVVHAAKSLGLDVVQANLEDKLSFPDNSQDWIICLDVLEHLINPFNLMSEIKRILKKDGKAIINVPNHLNFTGRLRILMGSDLDVHNFFPDSDEWNNPHLRFFTFSGYKKMLNTAGFTIIDDRCFRFHTVPLSGYMTKLGLRSLVNFLAKKQPSLFTGGFFVVIEKNG